MKRIRRYIFIICMLMMAGCKAYTQDSVPYVMNGEFVMEDKLSDYSICGIDLYLLNKSEKEIKSVCIVFFLFDKDGEPASECRNKISFEIEKYLSGGEDSSFCISLDKYMNSIPSEPLLVDYLYLSKIEYEDGSLWEDPYGLVAFK